MVAENEEVWYEDGVPLTLRLCEDTRQPDDVSPRLNYDCQVCDEAKYEVIIHHWINNLEEKKTFVTVIFGRNNKLEIL